MNDIHRREPHGGQVVHRLLKAIVLLFVVFVVIPLTLLLLWILSL